MLATYMRRMGNNNLEIRIAGSSSFLTIDLSVLCLIIQGQFKDFHRNLRTFQEKNRIKTFSRTLPTIQGRFKTAIPVTLSATIQNFRLDFQWFLRKMSPLPFYRSLISFTDLPRPRERTFQRKTEWDLDTKLHAPSKRIERIWHQTRETPSLQMVPCRKWTSSRHF